MAEYGNKGWPGLYLFAVPASWRMSTTERENTRTQSSRSASASTSTCEPVQPLRPEDVPGACSNPKPPTSVLPAERDLFSSELARLDRRRGLESPEPMRRRSSFEFSAGAALRGAIGRRRRAGLYETNGTVEAESPVLRLHGVAIHAFAASAVLMSFGT